LIGQYRPLKCHCNDVQIFLQNNSPKEDAKECYWTILLRPSRFSGKDRIMQNYGINSMSNKLWKLLIALKLR